MQDLNRKQIQQHPWSLLISARVSGLPPLFKFYLIIFYFISFICFLLFVPYKSFVYILWLWVQCFYGTSECANERASVSCVFSYVLFLLSVLPYFNVLVFVSSYYIILLSIRSLFFNKRQKEVWLEGRWWGGEEPEGMEGGETITRTHYVKKKKSIFNKRTKKITKKQREQKENERPSETGWKITSTKSSVGDYTAMGKPV